MRPLALALLLGSALPSSGRAQAIVRGLIAPTAEQPAQVQAGRKLAMVVRVASGLTPPPGIQTERALRGFAARVCRRETAEHARAAARAPENGSGADDAARGAQRRSDEGSARAEDVSPESAEACTALTVRNVRPVDAHSLVYRVEAPLPLALAAGSYDLELRFPGGSSRIAQGLRITSLAALPPADALSSALPVVPSAGCATSPQRGGGTTGLLLLALSWTLATSRRARARLE